jgi:hypothetical protein
MIKSQGNIYIGSALQAFSSFVQLGYKLAMMYFCVILCSLIFTNYVFSLHNIFYYIVFLLHVSTLCGHHQVLLLCTIILTLDSTFPTVVSVYMWGRC